MEILRIKSGQVRRISKFPKHSFGFTISCLLIFLVIVIKETHLVYNYCNVNFKRKKLINRILLKKWEYKNLIRGIIYNYWEKYPNIMFSIKKILCFFGFLIKPNKVLRNVVNQDFIILEEGPFSQDDDCRQRLNEGLVDYIKILLRSRQLVILSRRNIYFR